MKNLTNFLVPLIWLVTAITATAQIQQTQNVTFQTNNRSLWDPVPGVELEKQYLLLEDNGADASFFIDAVNIDAMIQDPNIGPTGFQILAKFGLDFDMYARYKINSGTADITYPVEIKFTKPNNGTYGCNSEVKITTGYNINQGYDLHLEEPGAEFAMGVQMDAGFFGGARACFAGNCDEDGEDHGDPTFRNANSNNYKNYLVDGDYDYLRINSTDGLKLPWDLVPVIPPPPGVMIDQYALPYEIDPAIENYANISGELDQPFRNFDRQDELIGLNLRDKGAHQFMDIEFDPIQFQEYLTKIPLTFGFKVGPVSMELDVLSIPFIFQNALQHEFVFAPNVKADLNLGRPMTWKEMKGNMVVQTGSGQLIENFTIGNDLVIIMPDSDPVNIIPTAKITNQFTSKLDIVFNSAIAFRMMHGNVRVDGVPADGPPLLDQDIPGLNETFPLDQKVNNVFSNTFEMGGFNTQVMDPIDLFPDQTPPSLTTKNITVYIPDAGGFATINPQDVVQSAFDQQDGQVRYLSVTPNTFSCSNIGANTVTVTVDDSRCNTTSGSAIVTVVDRTKPVLVCKPATVYLNSLGVASISQLDVYQSGSDNCGSVELLPLSKSLFDCSNIGSNVVVLTANDGRGNTNTCNATVTVIDNLPPTVVCKPATVYLNNFGSVSFTTNEVFQNGADNCGIVNQESVVPNVFSCQNIGDNQVTLTVNDGHGNKAACNATVTVLDKIAPVVVCKPATVDLDANGQGSITTSSVFLTGSDNCGIVNRESVAPSTFNCTNLGANTVVLTVNDSHGNTNTCNATVTVRDLIKPVAICPANIAVTNDPGICGANVSYTASATDNCSVASLIPVPASGSLFSVGTTQVKYTATDLAGNTATCTFTVKVTDNENPVITCPAPVNLENELGKCSAVATYPNATATDNCAVQSVVRTDGLPSGSSFPVGVSYVSYRATDIYGNSSTCSFSIEIRDTEAPKMVCPLNLNRPNDFGQCSRTLPIIGSPSQLSDNCGVYQVTNDSPVTFPIGETVVTWTIEDIHQNTATCAQLITIFDNDWPTITCPQNMKIKTDEGYCEASSVVFNATATDNCPDVMLEYDHDPNFLFPVGYTNVQAKATDAHGHESTCMFQVVVETRPEICNGVDDDCDGIADEVQDWREIFRAEAGNGEANDKLGFSVAIDGDWALAGAPGAGLAYLLRRSDNDPTEWIFVTEFHSGNNNAADLFGASVSLHNGLAVVGAPNDNTMGNQAGAVHIFAQDATNGAIWNIVKTLYADDATAGANFGKSVKLKGQTLLTGATGANAAYVFHQQEGGANNWGQVEKLIPSDAVSGSEFGQSLDFNQQTAVVGAPNAGAGAVYVFDPANGWIETQKLQALNGDAGDRFAQSISLEGSRLAIGAPGDDDKGLNAGAVYIFGKNQNGAFVQQTKILDVANGTLGDEFGFCVSMRGDYLAVGAPSDDLRGKDAGAVHIFLREDGGWIPMIALTQQGARNSDYFGRSLQLQPGTLIAGTPGDDIATQLDRGSAAIFEGLCSPSHSGQREEVKQLLTEANISLLPNPTTGIAQITFEMPQEQSFSIRAYDMSGRMVLSHDGMAVAGANSYVINMGNFADGIYLVEYQTEGTMVQKRLAVQKQ
ncbi:MAG TPA: HYR domain-containing protein [Saprospiraceae bacterium]|nr:HYR domain-containing protein [Saprospiraceae bacterium]